MTTEIFEIIDYKQNPQGTTDMIIKLINEMINIHRTRRHYFSTIQIHIPRILFHRFVLKKKALGSPVAFKIKE